jgi:hypothetical protein
MAETETKSGALVRKDEALARAGVAAAVAMAVYGLRKLLAEGGVGLSLRQHHGDQDERGEDGGNVSVLVAVWESAADTLVPLAEDVAEAAGKWTAKNSPALIRDRLLPRFIDSFKAA